MLESGPLIGIYQHYVEATPKSTAYNTFPFLCTVVELLDFALVLRLEAVGYFTL